MFTEIVIDTNILEHASNASPSNKHYYGAYTLLRKIIDENRKEGIKIKIGVDRKWDFRDPFNPEKNESMLVQEYCIRFKNKNLFGWIFLMEMFASEWVKKCPKFPVCGKKGTLDHVKKKTIKRLIHGEDPTDCIFVGVACSCDSQTLISNDQEHFPKNSRSNFKDELVVYILFPEEKLIIDNKFFSKETCSIGQ